MLTFFVNTAETHSLERLDGDWQPLVKNQCWEYIIFVIYCSTYSGLGLNPSLSSTYTGFTPKPWEMHWLEFSRKWLCTHYLGQNMEGRQRMVEKEARFVTGDRWNRQLHGSSDLYQHQMKNKFPGTAKPNSAVCLQYTFLSSWQCPTSSSAGIKEKSPPTLRAELHPSARNGNSILLSHWPKGVS